jgi:hypothetical protein
MLNLAGWFVAGAVPVGGAVSTGFGWVFPAIGVFMVLLLVLLAADSNGRRLARAWAGIRMKPFRGARKRGAFDSPRCAAATGV